MSAEALIAVGLLAAAVVPAMSFLSQSRAAKDYAEQRADLQHTVRGTLDGRGPAPR